MKINQIYRFQRNLYDSCLFSLQFNNIISSKHFPKQLFIRNHNRKMNIFAYHYFSTIVSSSFEMKESFNQTNTINENKMNDKINMILNKSTSIENTFATRYHAIVLYTVRCIEASDKYHDKIAHFPNGKWKIFLNNFRRRLIKSPTITIGEQETHQIIHLFDQLSFASRMATFDFIVTSSDIKEEDMQILEQIEILIFQFALRIAEVDLKEMMLATKALHKISDLRLPHEWYPHARLIRRKIIYHGGPTNSGKTYHALKRLRDADPEKGGGLYCGPLRLLALEVYEKLNKEGAYCNLLTGQEQKELPFASHSSCTIEMINVEKEYDVAVIDEIQMIGDDNRGWAWTKALLGIRANEIHLCGGLEALAIVQEIISHTNDIFEVKKYERLSKLKILDDSLKGDYSKVEKGDCIVCFSKNDIFSIRNQIEKHTKMKCAIIYGQLPPEVRSSQARLFNEGKVYDVLVSSDAIGMGLNLNIRRIIFHTTRRVVPRPNDSQSKSNTNNLQWISPSNIKQIAGRAGRLSSQYPIGEVTSWQDCDLPYIRAVMEVDVPNIKAAGVMPSAELITEFSETFQKSVMEAIDEESFSNEEKSNPKKTISQVDIPLSTLLMKFIELSKVSGTYFICDCRDKDIVSNWLHSVPLSMTDRFSFASAPVDVRNQEAMNMLYYFAATYAMKRPIALNMRLNRNPPSMISEFSDLCAKHNIIELYIWLSLRFPKYFVERDICLEQKKFAMSLIENCLNSRISNTLSKEYSHSSYYRQNNLIFYKINPLFLPSDENIQIYERTKVFALEMSERLNNTIPMVFPFIEKELSESVYNNSKDTRNTSFKKSSSFHRSSHSTNSTNLTNTGSNKYQTNDKSKYKQYTNDKRNSDKRISTSSNVSGNMKKQDSKKSKERNMKHNKKETKTTMKS